MTTDYARRHLVKNIRDFDFLKSDLSFFSSRFVRNGRHNGARVAVACCKKMPESRSEDGGGGEEP